MWIMYIILCLLVAVWGHKKGYNGIVTFIGCFIVTPVIGAIIVWANKPKRTCIYCKQHIPEGATVCSHCTRAHI